METTHYTPVPLRIAGLALLILALSSPTAPVAGDEAEIVIEPQSFGQALQDGHAAVVMRYRFEIVSDDAPAVSDQDAEASTLRTTLSYRSLPYRGFSFFIEAENVAAVGDDDSYRNAGAGSLSNGVTGRPVVADPEITEINQATLSLAVGETSLHLGRRELGLGNHRFVGNVGWRQNHQSFDSFSIVNTSLRRTTLAYHYLDKVNRIFGDGKAMASHLVNGEIEVGESSKLSFYGYLLDFDEAIDAALSTSTYGLRLEGSRPLDRIKVHYALEFADQRDRGDNPTDVDTSYYMVELGGGGLVFALKAGLEVLEGGSGSGKFTTPLATLHKFNGWADKFLATPDNGLEDLYLAVNGSVRKKLKWAAIYHDFSANEGGADYGTELDLLLAYTANWKQTFGLKAAFYDADTHAADAEKIMFWTTFRFGR